MNKLWVAIMLSYAVSISAAEKESLTLKWREEQTPEKADFSLKWREEQGNDKADFPPKWQDKRSTEKENATREWRAQQLSPLHKSCPQGSCISGRVHRSNRMSFIDPNYSAFNSDGGEVKAFSPSSGH